MANKIVNATQLDQDLTSVANAIRTKKGISKTLSFPTDFAEEINSMATVGNEQPIDDVTFVDYDGSVCYTYTADEFLALSELPPNPSHEGLVAQGWNWTLAGAKTYVEKMGTLCIGQNYTTDDGSTRVYVRVRDWMLGLPNYVCFYATVNGGVTIDWGDGNVETSVGTAHKQYSHIYEQVGDYVIRLKCTEGTFQIGYNGANARLLDPNNAQGHITRACAYKIEIGDNCTVIYRQGFAHTYNLETISFPTTLRTIGGTGNNGNVFEECTRLKCIIFPSGSTIVGANNNYSQCKGLNFISHGESMTLPEAYAPTNSLHNLRMLTIQGLTSAVANMGAYLWNCERFAIDGTYTALPGAYCREVWRLRKLVIPATVTSIADYAMTDNYLEELHMLSEIPPTIVNTRGMPGMGLFNGTIYVPYSSDHSILEAYKTATNWSTFASYMQEEPQ